MYLLLLFRLRFLHHLLLRLFMLLLRRLFLLPDPTRLAVPLKCFSPQITEVQ